MLLTALPYGIGWAGAPARRGALDMAVDDQRVADEAIACESEGFVFDEEGTMRRTTPCLCLPETGSMAGWLECASCGLPQAPGKDFCGFCGRRWVTAS
jgi:hypothetical protein